MKYFVTTNETLSESCQACSSIGEHTCDRCSSFLPHVDTSESYQHYWYLFFLSDEKWTVGICLYPRESRQVQISFSQGMCRLYYIHLNVIIFHSGKGSRFSFTKTLELPSCWRQVPGNKFSCFKINNVPCLQSGRDVCSSCFRVFESAGETDMELYEPLDLVRGLLTSFADLKVRKVWAVYKGSI